MYVLFSNIADNILLIAIVILHNQLIRNYSIIDQQ